MGTDKRKDDINGRKKKTQSLKEIIDAVGKEQRESNPNEYYVLRFKQFKELITALDFDVIPDENTKVEYIDVETFMTLSEEEKMDFHIRAIQDSLMNKIIKGKKSYRIPTEYVEFVMTVIRLNITRHKGHLYAS